MKPRLLATGTFITLVLAGCGTSAVDAESTRGVVLQYLGGDVGTAGPFRQNGKKELGVLSDADRRKAERLIDDGAVVFLVYGTNAAAAPVSGGSGGATRVVLVQNGRVVGDFLPSPAAR